MSSMMSVIFTAALELSSAFIIICGKWWSKLSLGTRSCFNSYLQMRWLPRKKWLDLLGLLAASASVLSVIFYITFLWNISYQEIIALSTTQVLSTICVAVCMLVAFWSQNVIYRLLFRGSSRISPCWLICSYLQAFWLHLNITWSSYLLW